MDDDGGDSNNIKLPFRIGVSPTLKLRGIIACKDIEKGEIIEDCPTILMPVSEEKMIVQTAITRYYFDWSKKQIAVALGYGSLINHSYKPNARFVFDKKRERIVFKAIKKIRKNEEILVNYNGAPDSKKPLGPEMIDFDKHRI